MEGHDDWAVGCAERIVDLLEGGVPLPVIKAAVNRSSDAYGLGALLGLLEDMMDEGVTFHGQD